MLNQAGAGAGWEGKNIFSQKLNVARVRVRRPAGGKTRPTNGPGGNEPSHGALARDDPKNLFGRNTTVRGDLADLEADRGPRRPDGSNSGKDGGAIRILSRSN